MASLRPFPLPPRTPTPPESSASSAGSEMDGYNVSPAKSSFDPSPPSPVKDENSTWGRNTVPTITTTTLPLAEQDTNSVYTPMSVDSTGSRNSLLVVEDTNGGFNFQPGLMAKGPVAKANIGQRRGHKYKHSSVSHQFFLEPTPRPPQALPNSLPVPTFKECQRSMTQHQKHRFYWSITHVLVAAYTLSSAEGSLALTAVSHLILFDSLSAILCVVVDILGNFEVWRRSSIRHPFGLERAEVLAGFAMSIFLLFMGLDLISHNLTHILESVGSHEPHHEHHHAADTAKGGSARVSAGEVDSAALLAIVSTLISALGLGNHKRIGKAMRFAYMESLPSVLSNPSHFLTISCSLLLLLLPLLSITIYTQFDRILSITIALSMCTLGFRLVKNLGFMLLMSYDNPTAMDDVLREVESDPVVMAITDVKIWQVHYGLCMAGLVLRVRGTEEGLGRLRERVCGLVRGRLGGGYGVGGEKWEVSLQLDVDRF